MWHNKVVERFKSVNKESGQEKDYYPAYDKLLNSIFPFDSDFTVAPQTYPYGTRESADFIVEYTIEYKNYPVFVLEIKPSNTLKYYSKREEADIQIRKRLRDLSEDSPINILYGVSAFGEQISIYNINKNTRIINPRVVSDGVENIYPIENWNSNILLAYDDLSKIFNYIKEECRRD